MHLKSKSCTRLLKSLVNTQINSIVAILNMNVDAKIIKRPEASTYVPGQTLTQKCSARSLYPMTVTWQLSGRNTFSKIVRNNSHAKEGFYNTLNSTFNVNISLMTPLSFKMRCVFFAYIYFQPDNFSKAHGLYQKGLLFERPKPITVDRITPQGKMTIQCKSIVIVLKTLIQTFILIIQGHHLSPLMSLISQ